MTNIIALGIGGRRVDGKSAWVLVGWFFSDVVAFLFVTLKAIKFIKLSLQVMAFKMDFVSISVPRKETNIFAMSPLCHI